MQASVVHRMRMDALFGGAASPAVQIRAAQNPIGHAADAAAVTPEEAPNLVPKLAVPLLPISAGKVAELIDLCVRETAKSLTFLVAEDNSVNQRLILRLLEKRGHSVVLTKNGREALDVLRRQSFDLILMDCQMPEMDGFETTQRIRSDEATTRSHIPIIALTAHAMKGDRERCLAAGMDGYVAKPIRPEDLFTVIESIAPHLFGSSPTPVERTRL